VVRDAGATSSERAVEATGARSGKRLRWALVLVLALKVASLGVGWQGGSAAVGDAQAQGAPGEAAGAGAGLAVVKPRTAEGGEQAKAATHASATDVKALLESLSRRQSELDEREKSLAAREDKLALYEKDVTEKIAHLEQVGKTLKDELERTSAASDEAADSLAKVYGAMKPAAAAPILDQLDEATALRILTRMKEKQVGEILPLLTRERAIGLTRSLAGHVPVADAAKPRG